MTAAAPFTHRFARRRAQRRALPTALVLGLALSSTGAFATAAAGAPPPSEAEAARADIKAAFDVVPGFMAAFPDEGIAGAWDQFKSVQANPSTAIPNKYKELIGLAVAAQIPCHYCVSFRATVLTQLAGASNAAVQEAIVLASIVRHWSTVLNGMQMDRATFSGEVDRAMAPNKKKSAAR